MKNTVPRKLQRLRVTFEANLPQKLLDIEQQWELISVKFDKKIFDEFHHAIHSLASLAGTYGHFALSQTARDLDIYLKQLIYHIDLNATLRSELSHLVGQIKDSLVCNEDEVKALTLRNVRVEPKLIVYFIHRKGRFERALQQSLTLLGYELILLRTVDAFDTKHPQALPAVILLDEKHLREEKIKEISQQCQRHQIPFICMAHHDNLKTRLSAIRAGLLIFIPQPVDVFYMTNRLVHLCGLSTQENFRILILDDSIELANYYALILKEAHMNVQAITKPNQLLEALQTFNPNLVLMDLYIPGCTGFELAMIIRQDERYASLPIIFISTESDRVKQLTILNHCGGDDFLTKPVLPQNLVAAVKSRAHRSALLASYIKLDGLTQLLNHTHVLAQLEYELIRAKRYEQPLTIVMIDLDNFKEINDKYGHPIGDVVLRRISEFLLNQIRKADYIGRYGGEEFILIFPSMLLHHAIKICDKIRKKMARLVFTDNENNPFKVTMSAGVADFPKFTTTDSLVSAADRALYKAKMDGKNCTEVADPG